MDIDLEKFFDRVNHDILMSRVGRQVSDKGVLWLIGRYLQAGMMQGALMTASQEEWRKQDRSRRSYPISCSTI